LLLTQLNKNNRCNEGGQAFMGARNHRNWRNPDWVLRVVYAIPIAEKTMKMSVQKLLLGYSVVMSTAFAAVLLIGAKQHRTQAFDEIEVHRINVVEPDGTLRMVISNRDQLPGVIVKGKEQPKNDRPQAGMLFYNDEGSENGGLIFGGRKNDKGEVVDSGGSLSFDKYGANQIVQLAGVDDSSDRFAGLIVNDDRRRIWVGRGDDGSAQIALNDAKGKKRLVLQVAADGTASLAFLDADGHVIRKLVPQD